MGEFRIGRKYAKHLYPDTPRRAAAAFARNSAVGPNVFSQALPVGGAKINWATIEAGSAPGSTDVPITPRATGIVRVIVEVVCQNASFVADIMEVQPVVDGATLPGVAVASTIDSATEQEDGLITIPLLIDLAGAGALTVGVTHNVEVLVVPLLGGASTSVLELSSIDLQELPPATG